MTDDDIRAHVMKAEGVLDQIQDKVRSQFGDARKAIMAIDRAYSQLLDSRDFYREARNELITDRDHWEAQAKEARAERDQLRRERERLRATGDQLKAEHVELRDSRKRWHNKFLEAMRERNALEADNEDLRAGQGTWPEHDDSPAGEQAPRVIDTRDLEAGQWVAWDRYKDGQWQAGKVEAWQPTGQLRVLGDFVGHMKADRRFILLEDATEPEPTIVREDDHQDADAAQKLGVPQSWLDHFGIPAPLKPVVTPPAPQLTVEDLDAAGVGSHLEIKSTVFIKTAKGGWSTYNDGVMGYPSEYMIRNGWDAATLTHPEEITPEPEPTSRLTVHQLDAAPVGSRVTKPGRMPRMKLNDGYWFANWDHFTPESSEGMIRNGYANATLSYPKRGDHE